MSRFTDAELAAEYWQQHNQVLADAVNGRYVAGGVRKENIILRFATLPHAFDVDAETP
jgi:hypothetical protein